MARWQITLEVMRTLAAVAVPVVVAVVGYLLSRRLKVWEAKQWLSQELIKARLGYYQSMAPKLNDLMCYFTFIGRWKEFAPPEVVALKRELDREFHSALPLLSSNSEAAYNAFMDACFRTFGIWGADAQLRTGYARRREAQATSWNAEWDQLFTHTEERQIPKAELEYIRAAYNDILRALAKDIQLVTTRENYASAPVSLNAQ